MISVFLEKVLQERDKRGIVMEWGFVAEMLNFLEERDSHTSLQRAKEGRGSGCDLNVSEGQR